MARKPRAEFAAGVWHVYARGNNKGLIFLDDADREAYCSVLARVVRCYRWRLMSYCLIPNHVHLLVETTTPNLGAGMRQAHTLYAQRFNRRHGRTGHLFGERFGATWIADDAHLWTAARYVSLNPVEAGLCDAPADFVWSSYAATIRGTAPVWLDTDRLIELFVGGPLDRFADFVAAT